MEILLRQMDLWYSGMPGRVLVEAERTEVEEILSEYNGRHLLQIGGPSEISLFQKSPIRHRFRLSSEYSTVVSGQSIQAYLDALPFLPESIDVILLPHVLEFVTQPAAILKEVYTILIPEGYVILLGFNPWSLWGLNKWWRRDRHLPWRGHFWSMMRVTRWLRQQGFSIVDQKTIFFRPPLRQKEKLNRLLFLEAMGRLCWSSMGAVYIIVAKKRVLGLTLLKEQLHPVTLS